MLLPIASLAQSNYKSGYIVTLSGDTLHGVINYREWFSNPKTIEFKPDKSDLVSQKYSVTNAKAFGIDQLQQYERFTAKISLDEVTGTSINVGVDSSSRIETAFFQKIASGKFINLYSYTDNLKDRYYISSPGNKNITELVYHKFYRVDDPQQTVYSRYYINQLREAAAGCNMDNGQLRTMIEHADYQQHDFVKIANKVNAIQKLNTNGRVGVNYFAGAAISINKAASVALGGFAYANSAFGSPYSNNTSTYLYAGILVYGNKNTKKLFLRAELGYMSDKHSYLGDYPVDNLTVTFNESHSTIEFTPQIGYNFYSTAKIKAGFSIGPGFHSFFSEKTDFYNYNYLINQKTPNNSIYSPFHENVNLVARASINVKAIEAFASYNSRLKTYETDAITISTTTFRMGVNYYF